MQLSNFIREEKEDEFIDLGLVAGIEVPNYVLIPEYLECTSSTGGSQTEDSDIENLLSTLEIDLAELITENSWKNNERDLSHLLYPTQDVCLIKNSCLLKMD